MKFRFLEYLRCPSCLSRLKLSEAQFERCAQREASLLPPCQGICPFPEQTSSERNCDECSKFEVVGGELSCVNCDGVYHIEAGVPGLQQRNPEPEAAEVEVDRTASSFGFLWQQTRVSDVPPTQRHHFAKFEEKLSLLPLRGLVLDAGCGEGIDLADLGRRSDVEIIGVDVSDGGCFASASRTLNFPNVHVVKADLSCLPFEMSTFDTTYSYGVLHHVPVPSQAASELARVVRLDAEVAVYVYEDFGERSAGLRASLSCVNWFRRFTTRLSPVVLYRLCQIMSPVVYLMCTVPFLIFKHIRPLQNLAYAIPFRHGLGPFSLIGDLYDRFSAPVEYRYNRETSAELLAGAGLEVRKVVYERGWMVLGQKSTANGGPDIP